MNPNLKQSRRLIGNATLFLLFALVVLGGVYFANIASGQGNAHPTPNLDRVPPEKQTVWARSFPTMDPKAPVAPPKLSPVPLPPETRGPDVPANVPQRIAGAGLIVENNGGAPLNHDYSVVNEWYATTASEKIRVFAGGIWNDPLFTDRSQGFVSVLYKSVDFSRETRPQVTVNTSSPTGA